MKKILFGLFLFFGFISTSRAGVFDDVADRTYRISYATTTIAATVNSTSTILIDLSDTTNWPHKETREINVSAIRVEIDKVAAATGTVRLGVFNMVNTTTGSITWFFKKSFLQNVSNADNDVFLNYMPNFIRTRVEGGTAVVDGTTPYILSTDKTSQSATYQSDVLMPTANGSMVAPARGDILVEWTKSDSSTWTIKVELDYNTPSTR